MVRQFPQVCKIYFLGWHLIALKLWYSFISSYLYIYKRLFPLLKKSLFLIHSIFIKIIIFWQYNTIILFLDFGYALLRSLFLDVFMIEIIIFKLLSCWTYPNLLRKEFLLAFQTYLKMTIVFSNFTWQFS